MGDEIRVCWFCGAENGPDSGTCGHCNHRLDDDPNREEPIVARTKKEAIKAYLDAVDVAQQIADDYKPGSSEHHGAVAASERAWQAAKSFGATVLDIVEDRTARRG